MKRSSHLRKAQCPNTAIAWLYLWHLSGHFLLVTLSSSMEASKESCHSKRGSSSLYTAAALSFPTHTFPSPIKRSSMVFRSFNWWVEKLHRTDLLHRLLPFLFPFLEIINSWGRNYFNNTCYMKWLHENSEILESYYW